MRAALAFEEVWKRTGLSVDELEMKVKGLEESASRLEPLAKEVAECEAQLIEIHAQSESLVEKVSGLEERREILQKNVRGKEQRETELSNRIRELEDRAQSVDERLTISRKDLKILSGIGIPLDNLSAFTQWLKVIAQRHGIKSEVLCSRLMDELEQLDEGLGLDTITKAKKQELDKLETAIPKMKEEAAVITTTNEKLRQERPSLRVALIEERRHITKDINTAAGSTITKLKQDLSSGIDESVTEVNKLRDRTLQLGKQLGQFDGIIESNRWLKSLLAMIKGDEEIEPDQVRLIGITATQAILTWLDGYS